MVTGSTPGLVLIGPPGSGKSTVGALVAEQVGVAFADTDDLIEAETGSSVPDIFLDEGEAGFRAHERRVVLSALTRDGVIALGGGAPMTPAVAEALAGHTVVFLDVGIADAAGRVGFAQSRPLLAVNPRASWVAMMNERRPTYERLATHRVDTAGRTPQDVATEVVALLEEV